MLIELRGTEFNREINLFRGLSRFNLGLALIGFRTTGARCLILKGTDVLEGTINGGEGGGGRVDLPCSSFALAFN